MDGVLLNTTQDYLPYISTFSKSFVFFWIVYFIAESVLSNLGKNYDAYHVLTPEKKLISFPE